MHEREAPDHRQPQGPCDAEEPDDHRSRPVKDQVMAKSDIRHDGMRIGGETVFTPTCICVKSIRRLSKIGSLNCVSKSSLVI